MYSDLKNLYHVVFFEEVSILDNEFLVGNSDCWLHHNIMFPCQLAKMFGKYKHSFPSHPLSNQMAPPKVAMGLVLPLLSLDSSGLGKQ